MRNAPAVLLLFTAASVSIGQGAILTEGFTNVSGLTGSGWAIINNSSPVGTTSWFQGTGGIFPSQAGGPDDYAAANLNSTGDTGNISTWLLTPAIALANGYTITVYTRTDSPTSFADNLEVRFSTNGASTNVGATDTSVGDFTNLLLAVNPGLDLVTYPVSWAQFTLTISGLAGPTTGRVAFRYVVPNGGLSGINSNYIGLDSLVISDIPEPGTWIAGLAVCALLLARRRMGSLI